MSRGIAARRDASNDRHGFTHAALSIFQTNVAAVSITHAGRECQMQAQLLIAADGRNSRLCHMAGIAQKQLHISNMIGYSLRDIPLPQPGFGHVFIGGPAPVLRQLLGSCLIECGT